MFFSVLVPIYNTSKYIDECFTSILSQDNLDCEIVLLDDGTNDSSGIGCDSYALKNDSVLVVHKKNEGLLLTRRLGFKMAKGEFLFCVDSDDYLADNKALDKVHKRIIDDNSDLVVFDYIYGGNEERSDKIVSFISGRSRDIEDKSLLYKLVIESNRSNAIFAKVPSRRIVDIDEDYNWINSSLYKSMGEDYIQSLPILTKATKVSYINEPLYYYRYNDNSISRRTDINYYLSFRTMFEQMNYYYQKWGIDNKTIAKQKELSQIHMVSYLISSIPNRKDEKKDWVRFVRSIRTDEPIANLANSKIKGKNNRYYQLIARLINNNMPYSAIIVVHVVKKIHKSTNKIRSVL